MRSPSRGATWPTALAAIVVLAAFWWSSTRVPFWQDDYELLLKARDQAAAGTPLSGALAPDPTQSIWRPIGATLWWRFIEGPLDGSATAAHLAGLTLLLLSAASVGWLAFTICRALTRTCRIEAVIAAGFLYGIHSAHLLPVAWTSAANNSFAMIFGALALRFWLAGVASLDRSGPVAFGAATALFALALLSRESAIVVPLLGATFTWWLGTRARMTRGAWITAAAVIAISLIWLAIHARFSAPPAPGHAWVFGANIVRNAAALALFLVNAPRESMRLLAAGATPGAIAWAAACVALQAGALLLLWREARAQIDRHARVMLLACAGIAGAPYLLLAWNSYEYYVSFALVPFAVVGAMAVQAAHPRVAVLAVSMALASSILAVAGSHAAGYPALIARAHWGERQLQLIEQWRADDPARFAAPVHVRIEDGRRFLAVGAPGLVYRLGLTRTSDIVGLSANATAPAGRPVIVFPADGDVFVR